MKLHTRWLNTPGERVRIALHLKGLAFEYIAHELEPTPEYRRINPQVLLPTLEIDGQYIAQSAAILEFLEERHPKPALLPADPVLRAQARAFGAHVAAEMHAITAPRVRAFMSAELAVQPPGLLRWLNHWMTAGFTALEQTLANRPHPFSFCFGETPGWADIHLVPQLTIARRRGFDPSAFTRLLAVEARCLEIEAFQRARGENQPDYPGPAAHKR